MKSLARVCLWRAVTIFLTSLTIGFSSNLVMASEKTKTNIPRMIVWKTFMEPKTKTTMKKGIEPNSETKIDLIMKYNL
jgi:hypothetical protein